MAGEATVHGVYDYWLGGWQHDHADREVGRVIEERFPGVPGHMREAHAFHLRVARRCAEQGTGLFIRAGAVTYHDGLNVHNVVHEVSPGARVCYVNEDPYAHELASRLLADGDRVTAVQAPVRNPPEVLRTAPVAEMLASGEPVCLIVGMVLHFAMPGTAGRQVAGYAAALPAGSRVVVSVAVAGDPGAAAEMTRLFTPARVYRYTAEDVEEWMSCTDLEEPGVADVRALPDCEWAGPQLRGIAPGRIVGAIGRVRGSQR